MPKELMIR